MPTAVLPPARRRPAFRRLRGLAAVVALAGPVVAAAEPHRWDGALGMQVRHGPEYLGADRRGWSLRPAIFLRYNRLSLSSGAGFAVNREDDLGRGLGLDLSRSETLRVSVGLRYDNGRKETDSDALAGLGDVRDTVRLRTAVSWHPERRWRMGVSWTVDAFGRGGGNLAEFGASWDHTLAPGSVLQTGASASLGGRRYMQTYHGVTAEQSARSGYPEYRPGTGWREATVFANLRHELDPRWAMQAGVSLTRLLGGTADSPLTKRQVGLGLSTGLAWRF